MEDISTNDWVYCKPSCWFWSLWGLGSTLCYNIMLKPRSSNLIVWRKFTNFFVCLLKRERERAGMLIHQGARRGTCSFWASTLPPPYVRFWSREAALLTLGNGALYGSMWTALPGNGRCFVMFSFPLFGCCASFLKVRYFNLFLFSLPSWTLGANPEGFQLALKIGKLDLGLSYGWLT